MAMLRLIARDSGWLAVLLREIVQNESRPGRLMRVGQSAELQEHFYAISTAYRHRIVRVERPLEAARSGGQT